MKKVLSLLLMSTFALALTGCVNVVDEDEPINCDDYPSHVDCVQNIDPTDPDGPGIVDVLDALPQGDDATKIVFWHTYGSTKEGWLNEIITEFEEEYPMIEVSASSKGGYDEIKDATIYALTTPTVPNLVAGYADHVVSYLKADGVVPLDDFIKDETWGVDLEDFVSAYLDENREYSNGLFYSFPYSKSTEMMVYNMEKFDAMSTEVEAALGEPLPSDRPLTWAELDLLADVMVGTGANQCEYLIGYDSNANFFINNVRMWQGGYTNSEGDILVDNVNTKAMLEYVKIRLADKTFVTPEKFGADYNSAKFMDGTVCMSVGSTAGVTYNVPDDFSLDVGVLPVPQYDEDSMSAVQQGPNLAIMKKNTSPEQQLASWLLIKWLTNPVNTANWAIKTGYLPVSHSGYNSDVYQTYLTSSTIADGDIYYSSLAAKVAFSQNSYFMYDPAFARARTSSDARVFAGKALDALYNYTAQEAIDAMLDNLNAN